jgi:hypothetical protein
MKQQCSIPGRTSIVLWYWERLCYAASVDESNGSNRSVLPGTSETRWKIGSKAGKTLRFSHDVDSLGSGGPGSCAV